jgi:ankyrin repeat protein
MCACASNHPFTCTLLLSHGADLCAINDRGMNVLHIAAFLGSLSIIHELLNSNIDDEIIFKALNQGDYRNQTPLFYACLEGHLDVALTFLHVGANVYHLDNDNQTCLHAMLSSSIILKRHIRLFYRFIEFVDYRLNQDYLNRTLLDLAYLNQLNTIIYLLTKLHYKRNYAIISNNECHDNFSTQVLSLRHLCILQFKRSIIYHQNQKQSTQHELLEQALQKSFHINLNREIDSIELSHRKSSDDISISNKKTSKSTKKSRKTSTILSSIQNDIEQQPQHTQSSWSIFTNKFKHQRTSNTQQEPIILSTSLPQSPISTNAPHRMKNLALAILLSPTKLDDLLDFPSLNNNHLLYDDMKTVMNAYNLEGTDSSNQI